MSSIICKIIAVSCAVLYMARLSLAQENSDRRAVAPENSASEAVSDVLPPEEWKRVDAGAARAIKWLATQQEADGSFPTMEMGEPGVTSLCVLAFMAHGHHPGEGEHGQRLERAIEFILSCQKENGLVCVLGPDGPTIRRNVQHEIGQTAAYNHAIASLTLAEIYGMGHSRQAEQIQKVIDKSLAATLQMQRWPKDRGAIDEGGWRYINPFDADDSDLSITGWSLMFLRSVRNAGFEVPDKSIDDAVEYVQHCFSDEYGCARLCGRAGRPSQPRHGWGWHSRVGARWLSRLRASEAHGPMAARLHVRSLQQRRRAAARPIPLQPVQLLPGNVSAWQPVLGAVLSAGRWPYSEAPGG